MVICQLKCRIIKDKKGGAPTDEAIGLLIFIFVAAFGLVFIKLFNISAENKVKEDLTEQKISLDGHSNLMSFLRQQVKGATISDIIINSYYSNDYSQLRPYINEYFNSKYSDEWIIVIEDSAGKTVLSANPNSFLINSLISVSATRQEVAVDYLPLNPSSGLNYLKIRLLLIKLPDATYGV